LQESGIPLMLSLLHYIIAILMYWSRDFEPLIRTERGWMVIDALAHHSRRAPCNVPHGVLINAYSSSFVELRFCYLHAVLRHFITLHAFT